eukprot:6182286-Pleurochrysis_carterae.AAC.1
MALLASRHETAWFARSLRAYALSGFHSINLSRRVRIDTSTAVRACGRVRGRRCLREVAARALKVADHVIVAANREPSDRLLPATTHAAPRHAVDAFPRWPKAAFRCPLLLRGWPRTRSPRLSAVPKKKGERNARVQRSSNVVRLACPGA